MLQGDWNRSTQTIEGEIMRIEGSRVIDNESRGSEVAEQIDDGASNSNGAGIVKELGELGLGAIITEAGLARMFSRHPASVKRAVERGELPPPTRLFGGKAWTVKTLLNHIEKRLERAAKEAEKNERKFQSLRP